VETGKNASTVIPASRKRRWKGNRISLRWDSASRPKRTLMRTYFWINLFTSHRITAFYLIEYNVILIANKEFKRKKVLEYVSVPACTFLLTEYVQFLCCWITGLEEWLSDRGGGERERERDLERTNANRNVETKEMFLIFLLHFPCRLRNIIFPCFYFVSFPHLFYLFFCFRCVCSCWNRIHIWR
jgi:hypothetical protein